MNENDHDYYFYSYYFLIISFSKSSLSQALFGASKPGELTYSAVEYSNKSSDLHTSEIQ